MSVCVDCPVLQQLKLNVRNTNVRLAKQRRLIHIQFLLVLATFHSHRACELHPRDATITFHCQQHYPPDALTLNLLEHYTTQLAALLHIRYCNHLRPRSLN